MKLIDKDALVAEIKKRLWLLVPKVTFHPQRVELEKLLSFIDTLEVKEVDLEKEATEFVQTKEFVENKESPVLLIAKHFFELGLKVNQENNVIGILEREVKIDAGGYPCIDCYIEFYDYDKDIPLAKEGDKVKVVIIKGE